MKEKAIIFFKNNMIYIVFGMLSLLIIFPILIYAWNSFPVVDDFETEEVMRMWMNAGYSRLSGALRATGEIYAGHGGYVFSMFLTYLLAIYDQFGYMGLGMVNVAIYIVFFICSFYMVWVFVKWFLNLGLKEILFIYWLFILSLFNWYTNSEIYNWYTVLSVYILPMSVMMLGFGLLIKAIRFRNKLYFPAAICAFLTGGATVNVAVLNCGMIFLVGMYSVLILKKHREPITVFIASLVGTLINVASPGNYMRRGLNAADVTAQGGMSVFGAIKNTFMATIWSLEIKIGQTPFLVVTIILLVILYMRVELEHILSDSNTPVRMDYSHPIIAAAVCLFGLFLINFPVCYGYGVPHLGGRGMFVQDMATYMLALLWAVYLIGWLKSGGINLKLSKELLISVSISCMLFIAAVTQIHGGLRSYTTVDMMFLITTDRLGDYVVYEREILSEIENSTKNDVVIRREKEKSDPYIHSNWLTSDSSFWINQACARYYGKDKVSIVYTEGEGDE